MQSPIQDQLVLMNQTPQTGVNIQEIYQNEINMVKEQIQRQLQDIYDYNAQKPIPQDAEEMQNEVGDFEDPQQIYA